MNDYNLTAGIHTLSVKTPDEVLQTPEISRVSKNPTTGITTLKINPNKLNGFITSYPDFLSTMEVILNNAGISTVDLVRVDMCFDSYDATHYQKYAKLNRLLISTLAQAYCVQNNYRTTGLFSSEQRSVAAKNPNSFEIENYDKACESLGKAKTQSRLELRSVRMHGQSIVDEFTTCWDTRIEKGVQSFDSTLERYNDELMKSYRHEIEQGNDIKYAVFFQIHENRIFTKKQAIELLSRMGVTNPNESYRYYKKKYKLVTYSRNDVIRAITEIKRARDAFFFGG